MGSGTMTPTPGPRVVRVRLPKTPTTVMTGSTPVATSGARGERTFRDYGFEVTDTALGKVLPIVYGNQRIACDLAYLKVAYPYIEAVGIVAAGESMAIDSIYLNDVKVWESGTTLKQWVTVEVRLGTAGQSELTIPSDTSWASSFPGYTLIAVKLSVIGDQMDVGIPQISVRMRGRKLYDPRTGQTLFSENPFLQARDLLADVEWGPGIPTSELDDTSLGAAATACDTLIGGVVEGFETANPFTNGSMTVARTTGSKLNGSYGLDCTNVQSANRQKTDSVTLYRPGGGGSGVSLFCMEGWVYDKGVATPANSSLPGLCFMVPAGQENAGEGYQVILTTSPTAGSAKLDIRKDNNSGSPLAQVTGLTLARQTWYRVTVIADEYTITVQVWSTTGQLLAQAQASDTTYLSGRVGLYSYDGTYFDDIRYYGAGSQGLPEPRYRSAVTLRVRDQVEAVINDMMLSCLGRWGWWDGKYRFSVDGQGSSAGNILDAPASGSPPSLGNAIILADGDKSSLRMLQSRNETPNLVKLTVKDPADWQERQVWYETSGRNDGSEQVRPWDILTSAVPSPRQGYRICHTTAKFASRLRWGCRVQGHGLQYAPGDIVSVTSRVGSLSAVAMRINSVVDLQDGTFELELVEYAAGDYTDDQTYSPTYVVKPSTEDSSDVLQLVDEFMSGGTTSGTIGELLWTLVLAGSATVGYTTENNYPGVLKLEAAPAAGSVAKASLDAASAKFGSNTKYTIKLVFKVTALVTNGAISSLVTVGTTITNGTFTVDASGNMVLLGTNLAVACPTNTWMTMTLTCAGDGTLYGELVYGTSRYTATLAVSGTTADKYLENGSIGSSTGPYGRVWIDRDEMRLVVNR